MQILITHADDGSLNIHCDGPCGDYIKNCPGKQGVHIFNGAMVGCLPAGVP